MIVINPILKGGSTMGKLSDRTVRRFVAAQESFLEAQRAFRLGTFRDFPSGMEKLAGDLRILALAMAEAFGEVKKELNDIEEKLHKLLGEKPPKQKKTKG
jgi:hypothetical protein